jgi:hypothetical protein
MPKSIAVDLGLLERYAAPITEGFQQLRSIRGAPPR